MKLTKEQEAHQKALMNVLTELRKSQMNTFVKTGDFSCYVKANKLKRDYLKIVDNNPLAVHKSYSRV